MFGIILGLLVLYHFTSFYIMLYHVISFYISLYLYLHGVFINKPHPISLGLASPALALVAASNFSWRVARLEGDLQPCKRLQGSPKKRTG